MTNLEEKREAIIKEWQDYEKTVKNEFSSLIQKTLGFIEENFK